MIQIRINICYIDDLDTPYKSSLKCVDRFSAADIGLTGGDFLIMTAPYRPRNTCILHIGKY